MLQFLKDRKIKQLETEVRLLELKVDQTDDEKKMLRADIRGLKEFKEVLEREVKDGLERNDGLKLEHRRATEKIQHEQKIADEDIKHLVKIKEESLQIEHDKKVITLIKEKDDEVAKIKDGYRDKMEEHLVKQNEDTKGMYSEILAHLPKVNANLGGGWNGDNGNDEN